MNITFVIDTYGITTNGTTITAMRSAEALRKRGHQVNILTGTPCDEIDTHVTGVRKIPILYQICKSQGMLLAKVDKSVMEKVIKQSDIVHFLLPFKYQKVGKKIADQYNIPTSAAFHLQPENITSTIYANRFKRLNHMIYKRFRRFYNQFNHIHCPSEFIAEQLRTHHYQSKLHVISNGVSTAFKPNDAQKPFIYRNKIVLLMIGRFSREKRQDLLIEAIKKSKHHQKIQLILAGQGPWKGKLKRLGRSLVNQPVMKFFEQKELINVINYADIYVHTSDTEAEAISCIEAFSCGLVPIISNSLNSATKQFALDKANLFEAGSSDNLSIKIDEFIDQPHRQKHLSSLYLDYANQFSLENSIDQLEAMFIETINDYFK